MEIFEDTPHPPDIAPQAPVSTDPVCPYCLQDPARISGRGPIALAHLYVWIVYCGNPDCRKVWTVEVVGAQQPRIQPGIIAPPS